MDFSVMAQKGINNPTIGQMLKWQKKAIFKYEKDKWWLNKDFFKDALASGFPLLNANKIVHCQTLHDPANRKSGNI